MTWGLPGEFISTASTWCFQAPRVGLKHQENPMTLTTAGTPMPASVSSHMAWASFEKIFTQTSFRLQIAAFDPISLTVKHDAEFGLCLAGSDAWEPIEQAKCWVANRVLSLTASLDKTAIRRLCLQHPRPGDETATNEFVTGLQRRIKDDVRMEISRHYDQSIQQWEDDAMAFVYGDENPHDRVKLFGYAGLDQLVSIEAGRKALKWVCGRTHWHLTGTGAGMVLNPDYRFDFVKSQRGTIDETTRARSLVARCVEGEVNEGVRRAIADDMFAPVTRASIKADLTRMFEKDGVWGLIHRTLVEDRRRYHITPPPWSNARATALLERQGPYLFEPTVVE